MRSASCKVLVLNVHYQCCALQRQAGKEGPMLFCNVSSILPQYRTQRFSVYGWARAHPSKSTTRSAGSSSEHVVLDRQTNRLPDERTLHATELAAGHRASRRAQARLLSTRDDSEDRRSRPRIELRFTNGWRDERANGEIVCRSESCGSSKRERNLFFLEIVYAIQFKGTVQLTSAKSRQPLMPWRRGGSCRTGSQQAVNWLGPLVLTISWCLR